MNDIVHGIISLPPFILAIIDTVQFQRLKSIAQLGFCQFVYPSASYSRFEHSIGTFHLASQLIKNIQRQMDEIGIEELKVTNDDVKCVEIAALCHDLGHGPFSHSWEYFTSKLIAGKKSFTHERLSVEIFTDLVNSIKRNHTRPIKDEIGLTDDMIDLIGNIILGKNVESCGNKCFIFEIVTNKSSGLDVDKFDYLCRDSIYLGWSNKNKIHDIMRFIHLFSGAEDKASGKWHLAIRDREIFHVHDIFYYRHMLYRNGYHHKTVKAVECMFANAIVKIFKDHREDLISNVMEQDATGDIPNIFCSRQFISRCNDHHIWSAMTKHSKDMVRNILERNLYKLFCKLQLTPKENTQVGNMSEDVDKLEKIFNRWYRLKFITEIDVEAESSTQFVSISFSKFSLTSEKNKDPILSIPFYCKGTPNECFYYDKENNKPPTLVKLINDEFVIMIFTESPIDKDSDKFRCLDKLVSELCKVDKCQHESIEYMKEKYQFIELKY